MTGMGGDHTIQAEKMALWLFSQLIKRGIGEKKNTSILNSYLYASCRGAVFAAERKG